MELLGKKKKKNPHISQIFVVALKSFFVKAEVHVGKNARWLSYSQMFVRNLNFL